MRTVHIAFSVNNNYVNHLITTVYSLFRNNAKVVFHIHVLSSDISEQSQQAVNLLKELSPQSVITYHTVDAGKFKNLAITMDYITLETYYRLMLAEIMDKSVEKILYLDADILVKGDVAALYDMDVENYYAAGVPDIYLNEDKEYKASIGVNDNTYINAGILLLNLAKIRQEGLTKTLISNAQKKTHKYQDQDAINVTFAGKILIVEKRYNYIVKDHVYETLPNEKMNILHYSGSLKPWNRDRVYDAFGELYDEYRLSGTKFINERNKNVRYGLLKYSTDNVGDSIQGIAARRFLPQVDYYFERDNMDATKTGLGETVKVIINGWWGDGPENWPPMDQNLDILPISMYVEDRIQPEFKKPRSKQLLKAYGPIGARSRGTETFLKDIGVDSYFSGCMTLTINLDKQVKKQDFVLAVDVPDSVYEKMVESTDRRVIRIGVLRDITENVDEQYKLGEYYLFLYQSAHAVVTTRLHTMLPSIALGTPVLFINDILDDDDVRFSGLAELAHNLRSDEYVARPSRFDINNPPANKKDYVRIRESLEAKASQFTGYKSEESYLTRPVSELLTDLDMIQVLVGGASGLGDLIEKYNKLAEKLSHKENHVLELTREIEQLEARIKTIQESVFWKVSKPIRSIVHRNAKRHDS